MKRSRGRRQAAAVALVMATAFLTAVLALAACGGSGATGDASSASPSGASAALSASASPSVIPLPTPTVAGSIAFTRYGENEWTQTDTDICVVDTDGTGLRVLAGGEGCQSYPRWSPDGKRIVYHESSIDWQDPQHVWVMNADGSGKVQLTEIEYGNMFPSWSPDGTRIVFTHLVFYTDGVGRDAIYVMNADGSGLRNVTSKKGPGVSLVDYWPTWERDGTISFYRNTGSGGLSKFGVNPDGSGLTRLVKQAGTSEYQQEDWWVKHELALSPDGKKVARREVKADRLVVVPVRGGGSPVTLLDPVAAYAEISVDVAWSPDGKALAIAAQNETPFSRLYIVNADGTGLSAVPGVDAAMEPAWRPE
jgi:Tol biopolymer transport system component